MNLTIDGTKLRAIDNKITSSDSIIKLKIEIDCVVLGILTLFNGTKKVIEFVKENDESDYKIGRLIIEEQDVQYLSSAKFYIELINGELKSNSNMIDVKFDISLIKTDIKHKLSNEYKELVEKVHQLEEKISFYSGGKLMDSIKIINKDTIQKGMIPVAIDDKGNFVALYPFSNHILEVNGQRAANGAVIIDSSMIKYKKNGKSTEQELEDQANVIILLKNVVDKIVDNQKSIMRQLNDLDMRLSQHINNGIV